MARLNHVKSFRGTSKTSDGNLTCGSCGDKVKPGDGYRWWANKLPGSRGSFRNIRCMKDSCTPRPSQMKPGRTGQIMAMGESLDDQLRDLSAFTDTSDFESIRDDLAQEITSFGEEIEESAQNIEDGFGHETSQSADLRDRAERITQAAGELESIQFPEHDEHQCAECDGNGEVEQENDDAHDYEEDSENEGTCEHCGQDEDASEHDTATETVQCESCEGSGHDMDSWRSACEEALTEGWSEAEGEMYG